MTESSRPFRYYLRVRYGEVDMQKVVYNPRYGEYVDIAGSEFLKAALPDPADLTNGNFEYQLVKLLIEWKGPARFDDVLEIEVRSKALGRTSFTLAFAFRKRGESEPFLTAETVNVLVDAASWQKRPIPADLAARLQAGARGVVVDHAGHGPQGR